MSLPVGSPQRRRPTGTGSTDLAPEIRAVLVELARAHNYSRSMETDPWEFALEIDRLLARGLETSDLRWLVRNGYVQHAREITQPGDERRRFQPSGNTAFAKETCFILTHAGLLLAGGAAPRSLPFLSGAITQLGELHPVLGSGAAPSTSAAALSSGIGVRRPIKTPCWRPFKRRAGRTALTTRWDFMPIASPSSGSVL